MNSSYNITDKSYSSKIILFGEYGVIHGGEILATPLSLFSSQWKLDTPNNYHKNGLLSIVKYLIANKNEKIDLELFSNAIEDGIHLESNIPSGYGLGSSGAITAGIYDLFVPQEKKALKIPTLIKDLIAVESCFHGVSSGIDPLVIYLNQSIHIDQKGIHIIKDHIDLNHYFLIDTGISRKTSPYVNQFLEKTKRDTYKEAIEHYKKLCSIAIEAQLANDQEAIIASISAISHWQYKQLDFAILDDYRQLWKNSLESDEFSIKLCGAGGGGFLLGYAQDVQKVMADLGSYNLIPL